MLTIVEYQILQSVLSLKKDLYSREILNFLQKEYSEQYNSDYSIGALFTNLERLENKKFVSSYSGEKTKARGGKAKSYYTLTDLGKEKFNESTERFMKLINITTSTIG